MPRNCRCGYCRVGKERTVSDPIEPTEAEANTLGGIVGLFNDKQLKILRAHVAAEVAKATGELLKDKERLESLLALNVEVYPTDDGRWILCDFREQPPKSSEYATARQAIDAARAQ